MEAIVWVSNTVTVLVLFWFVLDNIKQRREISRLRRMGDDMAILLNRRSQGGRISSVRASRAVSKWWGTQEPDYIKDAMDKAVCIPDIATSEPAEVQ